MNNRGKYLLETRRLKGRIHIYVYRMFDTVWKNEKEKKRKERKKEGNGSYYKKPFHSRFHQKME